MLVLGEKFLHLYSLEVHGRKEMLKYILRQKEEKFSLGHERGLARSPPSLNSWTNYSCELQFDMGRIADTGVLVLCDGVIFAFVGA